MPAIPESVATIIVIAVCALLLWLLFTILRLPLKLIFKLLLNMISGLVLLFVFNFIGGYFDFALGINALNALVAGILGGGHTPGTRPGYIRKTRAGGGT